MITRARQLDPLAPKYDVLKAMDLFYGHSDVRGADALLTEIVAHHPTYLPALMRLADVRIGRGVWRKLRCTTSRYSNSIRCRNGRAAS